MRRSLSRSMISTLVSTPPLQPGKMPGSPIVTCGLCMSAHASREIPCEVSEALAHSENVSLGILEPRSLRAPAGCDAVDGLDSRHVVLLELDAFRFQLRNFGRDVVHGPERG